MKRDRFTDVQRKVYKKLTGYIENKALKSCGHDGDLNEFMLGAIRVGIVKCFNKYSHVTDEKYLEGLAKQSIKGAIYNTYKVKLHKQIDSKPSDTLEDYIGTKDEADRPYKELFAFVSTLKERDMYIVVKKLSGYTYGEIAITLGLTRQAIESRYKDVVSMGERWRKNEGTVVGSYRRD